jgi:hypothetical protein
MKKSKGKSENSGMGRADFLGFPLGGNAGTTFKS